MKVVFVIDSITELNNKLNMLKTRFGNDILYVVKSNLVNLVKINIGLSWVGVIMGEFIVSRKGIGYLVVYGSQIFKLDLVMMGILVLSIIAYLMYQIVNFIECVLKKKISK